MQLQKQIKLNMEEYTQRKQFGRCALSRREKEARILDLAKKMNIKIKDNSHERI